MFFFLGLGGEVSLLKLIYLHMKWQKGDVTYFLDPR